MSDIPRYISIADGSWPSPDGEWCKWEDVVEILTEMADTNVELFVPQKRALEEKLAAKDNQIEELKHPWILMTDWVPEDHHPCYFVIDQSELRHVAYWDHPGEPHEGWWIIDGARHEQSEIIKWMESPD